MTQNLPQIARAVRWLLHSGIQESSGGVARFYRTDREANNPVSTEITGYHVSALIWVYRLTGDTDALSGAQRAADFLIRSAWKPELRTFPFEYPDASPAYFFDCGIIARGLLAAGGVLNRREYRDVAEACATQMATDFDAGFDFHPVLELPSKAPALRDPRWSRSSGCYQLKAALPFLEFPTLQDPWRRLLKFSLDRHDQFLPGHTDPERVMDRLHAYCYFLEALLVAPSLPGTAAALQQGVQRVAYLLHRIAPVFVRSDVYAQLLRIRLYADALGLLALDSHTAALEAEQLVTFQITSDDKRLDGGFRFGRRGAEPLPFANPVSTDFAIEALHLWHCWQNACPLPPVAGLL